MPRKQKPLKKFVAAYAYSVSHYADMTVEAASESAAKRKLAKALRDGRFSNVNAEPNYDCIDHHRVMTFGESSELDSHFPDMEQLIKEADDACK